MGASGALLGRLRAVWALPVAWAPSRAPLGRRLGHRWGAVWVEFLGRPFAQTLGSPPRRRLGPGSWGVPLPEPLPKSLSPDVPPCSNPRRHPCLYPRLAFQFPPETHRKRFKTGFLGCPLALTLAEPLGHFRAFNPRLVSNSRRKRTESASRPGSGDAPLPKPGSPPKRLSGTGFLAVATQGGTGSRVIGWTRGGKDSTESARRTKRAIDWKP